MEKYRSFRKFQITVPVCLNVHNIPKPLTGGKTVYTPEHTKKQESEWNSDFYIGGGAVTTGTLAVLVVVTHAADTQATPVEAKLVGTLTCHHNPS
jgi:hypothetical protein